MLICLGRDNVVGAEGGQLRRTNRSWVSGAPGAAEGFAQAGQEDEGAGATARRGEEARRPVQRADRKGTTTTLTAFF